MCPVGTQGDILIHSIIKEMFDMFDAISCLTSGLWRKKLTIIALLSLYPTNNHILIDYIIDIINMIDSLLIEEYNNELHNPTINVTHPINMSVGMSVTAIASHMTAINPEDYMLHHTNIQTTANTQTDAQQIKNEPKSEPIIKLMSILVENDIINQTSLLILIKLKINILQTQLGNNKLNELFQSLAPETIHRIMN